MTEKSSEYARLFDEPEVGIKALQGLPPLKLEMDPAVALALLGHLQLALRHPAVGGATTEIVRGIAKVLEDHLSQGGPELKALAQAGWLMEHDR
jgi:hypothetical protein